MPKHIILTSHPAAGRKSPQRVVWGAPDAAMRGPVVGTPREGSSFVSGDAVNVAARLEQAAEPGEILAGDRTVASIGWRERGMSIRTTSLRPLTFSVPSM